MGDTLRGTALVGAQDFIREGSPYMVRAGVLMGTSFKTTTPDTLPVLRLEHCLSASAAPGLLALRTLSTLH